MTDKETDIVHPISVEGESSRRETSTPLRDKFQHILTFRAMSGLQEKKQSWSKRGRRPQAWWIKNVHELPIHPEDKK